ncbi:6-pyruvoyltetrahydropterin/6-carboxytetrahydropterin synthase [Abditibacterium utsteinense]|uniref:6-carboxy-5,6,7,8-tetrahydropterin synthase n=1 Tax=Abditibacterium utsteinense TaxID=1960156 RepID=A0A2S8SXA5_9BACT|nr:6-carboxytetrahydropterin synthase [Abditibacterium utsteinense]PQV65398.1 6-pyruvoyltetrahydropterin/6-carboxytetrahydropterin synthase [Abditibacterium utsteinense]
MSSAKNQELERAPRVLLSRRSFFSCGRRLRHPDWNPARNREIFGRDVGPHGHEYTLDCAFSGPISTSDGMIVNITDLKPILESAIAPLNGAFLPENSVSELQFFAHNRPTAENIALWLWQTLPHNVAQGTLFRLQLRESRRTLVEITAAFPSQKMKISRSYEFAAAHRLAAPQLSDDENFARFDKCSNLAGHGHNFGLDVFVEGNPDAETGFIINPILLDKIVDEEIFERFDHKHLNVDCPEFRDLIPTTENLSQTIFEILRVRLESEGFKLAKIGLHETQKNYFEVEAQ